MSRAGGAPARWQGCYQSATVLLAYVTVKTLYLRNVPAEVAQRLEALAAREGLSVSAFAVRELADLSRRADNRALLGDLPHLGVSPEDVVADLQAERGTR